jgi:hypothetical protein
VLGFWGTLLERRVRDSDLRLDGLCMLTWRLKIGMVLVIDCRQFGGGAMALISVDSCKVREGFGEENVVNKANGGAAGLKHWVGHVNRIEGVKFLESTTPQC